MKIKESIVFPFVMWMMLGNHHLTEKKGNIVMRRNGKTAQIYFSKDDYFEINDYCAERYTMFLKQWLNNGVDFLNDLKMKGAIEVKRLRGKSYMELLK